MLASFLASLRQRAMPDGGFSGFRGGESRVDSTAWAILALSAAGVDPGLVGKARASLAGRQQADGRVCVSAGHPAAFWPTPLAVLAWRGSPAHREAQSRAARFLLDTAGRHWSKRADSPADHDTSIRGWPWVADTHSMVEPTSLALIALRASGFGGHERFREAVRMLLDRRLPGGGWNYGNTRVYGQELHPQVLDTGVALTALAGEVPAGEVRPAMEYLETSVRPLRTPLSLGWGLLGLAAWGRRPASSEEWIGESARRQERHGPYDTPLLSLLVLALRSQAAGSPGVFGDGKEGSVAS